MPLFPSISAAMQGMLDERELIEGTCACDAGQMNRSHPSADRATRWHVLPTGEAIDDYAFAEVARLAGVALASRDVFRIVLAGGNTPRNLYRKLRELETDWSRWEVYFGDERCVPPGDVERNDRMAFETLTAHVPIPPERIHVIPAERGPIDGANEYARALSGVGDFDLVLLGLGDDGHTASLFPGDDRAMMAHAPDVLPVFDAPKPPRERVSLGATRLSRTRAVLFLVTGGSKRDAVLRWRQGQAIPAASIRCPGGVDVLVERSLCSNPTTSYSE